jgi:hypothetical protein
MALLERRVEMAASEQGRREIPEMVEVSQNHGHNLTREFCDGHHGMAYENAVLSQAIVGL